MNRLGSFDQFECIQYLGQLSIQITLEFNFGGATLFCSGSKTSPNCSKLWFPNELLGHIIVTSIRVDSSIRSGTFLCRRASGSFGVDNHDCAVYSGGNPASVSFYKAFKCAKEGLSYICRTDYYPNEVQ
jgi:hypothetical protein